MNAAQELLHSGHCCIGALQAGRAPAHWQRELQQQTTRIKALPQSCHWIASVAKVQMKLQEQPLLGSCLPTLTGGTERASTHPPVTHRRSLPAPQRARQPKTVESDESCPRPRRFARRPAASDRPDPCQPERTEQLAQSAIKEPDTDTNHCSAREPLHLPPKASADLLQCLVEKPSSVKPVREPVIEPKSQDTSSPEIPTRKHFTPIPAPPPCTRKPPHDACLDITDQKRWRQQLVQQTNDCLRSESNDLNFSEPPVRKRIELPSFVESANESKQGSLNDPWQCSLGTKAPLGLLTDLATPRSTISNQETAAKSDVSDRVRSLPISEPHSRSNYNSSQVSTQPRPASVAWQDSQSQSPLEMLSQLSDRATKKSKITELERIDPPAVAPTLPPLVASQTGEAPTSVTTPLIQQRATQEAIPEADLDGLASQIKRILDEEARRYGINV
ncbi:MAG: hypothetical protein LH702_29515 [Phormidesmis sp. CAN_BIN44]|nr:hypothetical protein [Phormidesmis sp. CAN_BIN44]